MGIVKDLIGQIVGALVIGGVAVAWFLYANKDFGVMMQQIIDAFLWIGTKLEPLIGSVVNLLTGS